MDEIYGGSFFVKFILKITSKFRMFFSERGEEIPFTIQNIAERDEYGRELVRWNRTFISIIRKDILMQLCNWMKTKMKL